MPVLYVNNTMMCYYKFPVQGVKVIFQKAYFFGRYNVPTQLPTEIESLTS